MSNFDERVKSTPLTKTERLVAEFISGNYNRAAFMKASDIAAEIGVSPSSVVHLSRTLGYSGYADMMARLQAELLSQIETAVPPVSVPMENASPSHKLSTSLMALEQNDPLKLYLSKSQTIIDSVFSRNDLDKFLRAEEIIAGAQHRYIAGFYGCRGVADLLAVHMRRIFPATTALLHADADTIAQAVNITPNDCLILFSYERYADMAIKLADIAHRFGAKIIAVTDKITSPIAEGADVVFLSENDGGSFFNSSIALLMIAEMLALVASKDRYSEIESHLDLIDEYLAKGNLY